MLGIQCALKKNEQGNRELCFLHKNIPAEDNIFSSGQEITLPWDLPRLCVTFPNTVAIYGTALVLPWRTILYGCLRFLAHCTEG